MKNIKNTLATLSIAAILTSCGGSGGGDTPVSGLSFPINATQATANTENAKQVAEAVGQNQSFGLNAIVGNDKNKNLMLINRSINQALNKVDTGDVPYSLNEVIDSTENCTNGGTVVLTGESTQVNGGFISATFNQCVEGSETTNGSIYATVSNYNEAAAKFENYAIKFTSAFTFSDTTSDVSIVENSQAVVIYTYRDNGDLIKFTSSIQATENGNSYGMKDAVFYFNESSTLTDNSFTMYQTSGKIYINNLNNYVDYDTTYDMSATPIAFDTNGNIQNGGEARYNMNGVGRVKITIEDNAGTPTPKVYVDADGDGVYESSSFI